ncbi:cholinephosphotransferase 1-like [Halichondria panicea]|uniref:cholinephosphotransferase 1-like n=1 Tax=Halichondria panicea TaxID=6063 RepID=UPI00312B4257
MRSLLTHAQLERLKDHKYSAKGTSLSEVFMQPFWKWLVTKVPLWVAPNLLTFVGLVINIFTCLPVMLTDLNTEGKSPPWTYVLCAVGFFVYQSLDAIDGKQARRTNSSTPLGEFFDHGCDAISIFFVAVVGMCATGMHDRPYAILFFVLLILELTFVYHWQTYVCGTLHFKTVDVTEAQFTQMAVLLVAAVLGDLAWDYNVPVLGVTFREGVAFGTIFMSLANMAQAFSIILTSGVGKNGSTVADTSVLSPIFAVLLQVPVVIYYAHQSPGHLLENHSVLFLSAFCMPIVKSVMLMMLSGMTKSPFPLVDVIMLGPLLAYLNLYLGRPLPEYYVAIGLMIYNILDISTMSVSLCRDIAAFLRVSVFSIPYPSKTD